MNKKYNEIIKGDVAKIICYCKGERYEVLIDAEDVDKVKDICWNIVTSNKTHQYCCSSDRKLKLHRFITKCPKNMVVDHINHDTLDNRKSNLRICSHADNIKNRKVCKANKSGVPGVWKDESRGGKYRVTVGSKYIGLFESFEEAVEVRERVAKEEFREFYNEEG